MPKTGTTLLFWALNILGQQYNNFKVVGARFMPMYEDMFFCTSDMINLESNPVLLLLERSLREVLFTKSSVIKVVTQTQFETCVTAFILLIS